MKKSLIALAALAAVGAASAQSSVTLSGTLDTGLEKVSGQSTQLSSSRGSSDGTSITLSGVEDLGRGLKGIFKVSTSFDSTYSSPVTTTTAGVTTNNSLSPSSSNITNNSATNTNATTSGAVNSTVLGNNEMYVGVSSGFGKVLLGRPKNTLTSFAMTATPIDRGVTGFTAADSLNIDGKFVANGLQYISPAFNGLTVQLEYAPSEQTNVKSGGAAGLRYDNGPLAVSFVSHHGKATTTDGTTVAGTTIYDTFGNASTASTATSNQRSSNIAQFGVSYDFGPAKLYFTNQHNSGVTYYGTNAAKISGSDLTNSRVLGVSVPLGAGSLWAQYGYQQQVDGTTGVAATTVAGKGTIFGLGYKYALSKRTSLYAQAGNRNSVEAYNAGFTTANNAANTGKSGYGFGLAHSF